MVENLSEFLSQLRQLNFKNFSRQENLHKIEGKKSIRGDIFHSKTGQNSPKCHAGEGPPG